MSDESRFKTFKEFWPYYVREHANPWTRRFHFVGTTAAVTLLGVAALRRRPGLIPLALVSGYGPAWISHFFIEKNKPATFKYPVWSLLADFKMWSKMARGKMDRAVERAMATKEVVVEAPANGVGKHAADVPQA